MPKCLLCERELSPLDERADRLWNHPKVDDCLVEVCDKYGVSVDDVEIARRDEAGIGVTREEPGDVPLEPGEIRFDRYWPTDDALARVFSDAGLDRLGGASTGHGWSSFKLFQTCPYAWKRRYIENAKPFLVVEAPGIALGSLVHAFLAVMYMQKIVDDYPLTPEALYEGVKALANPEYVTEAWRIFTAYRLFYAYDAFTPLAVEYDLRDPRTGESCRYDLVAFFPDEAPMRLPGTYIIEHKTAQRFDYATLEGWGNDGEVLGQVMLWKRLGLDKRFGPLRGVIMNICGKQKDAQFHRTIVSPNSWQIEQHGEDLKRWEGLVQLSRATNNFPRSRHSCVSRFGMCQWFDHCATGE